MQTQNVSATPTRAPNPNAGNEKIAPAASAAELAATAPGAIKVIRRNGKVTNFDANKIAIALTKAFLAVEGGQAAASARVRDRVNELTASVVAALTRHLSSGGTLHIEDIQDQVELGLMRAGEHKVARDYVLYREERARARAAETAARSVQIETPALNVKMDDGRLLPLDQARLQRVVTEACAGLSGVDADEVLGSALRDLYDGIAEAELSQALTLAARARIEKEPNYTYVSARLLCDAMRHEALSFLGMTETRPTFEDMKAIYADYFREFIHKASELELVDSKLCLFDLDQLGRALLPERDAKFDYLGLQTLYDRYFIHSNKTRFELPQAFFMRVAMGLAMNEIDREARAIEFYTLMSSFDFMSSTPTLFNSGTLRPQLSSCYLTQVPDDLHGIFNAIHDNAMLSKFAGGLGNDWTPVRGMGGWIKGTNGKSNGVVPFLKVANDTAVAVNQGGKRKGAACIYLETWHADIEEFLELRDNTGDEMRRTHNLNLANWVPDLFMHRVENDGDWSLFDPNTVPEFVDLWGEAFERAYAQAEQQGLAVRTLKARDLYARMMKVLGETGNGWMTFKDASNRTCNQVGPGRTVHLSNLCTEILEVTSAEETAVCNLGSINLARHVAVDERGAPHFDFDKLAETVRVAVRQLDRVIDLNFYPIESARRSNLRWRPVGLGVMGLQDVFFRLRLSFDSAEALALSTRIAERVYLHAIETSCELAEEHGAHPAFVETRAAAGTLQFDLWDAEPAERDAWEALKPRIAAHGLRNSLLIAIAPTATIASIAGCYECIEPQVSNLFKRETLSGDFLQINRHLVDELKRLGLWTEATRDAIKLAEGSVQGIDGIPDVLKSVYRTAWELPQKALIDLAAARGPYIDQSQSLNLFMESPNIGRLSSMYMYAWKAGLKTTYYLRSRPATRIAKATVTQAYTPQEALACSLENPEACEACQ